MFWIIYFLVVSFLPITSLTPLNILNSDNILLKESRMFPIGRVKLEDQSPEIEMLVIPQNRK
jgi:hypothetical protein